MESGFSLRPATLDDISQIIRIEGQSHRAPWTEDHFVSELTKPYSQFLVLTDDETDSKIAGYIVCWLMFEECQILNIVVDLPFRGLGYAKLMLVKSIYLAGQKGLKKVVLDVRKSNDSAVHLYQGLRFVITHIRKGFYSDGEDAYQMMLSLTEEAFEF